MQLFEAQQIHFEHANGLSAIWDYFLQ
jgi:hypothetical protein